MDIKKLNAIADKFQEDLEKYNINAEITDVYINDNGEGEICWEISWGDWKHDHIASEKVLEEILTEKKAKYNIFESYPSEQDGSDCYSASHNAIIE